MEKALWRSSRKLGPVQIRRSRVGVTSLFGGAALLLIVAAGWILDLRGDREEVRQFGQYAQANKRPPVQALVEAARAHRFVFLSDIWGSLDTK
jgi:hypothetical protein